jgi:hypothetical protein
LKNYPDSKISKPLELKVKKISGISEPAGKEK